MRTLILAKCPGITLNSMHGFPELRHLDLTGCDGIAPGTAVSDCPPQNAHIVCCFFSARHWKYPESYCPGNLTERACRIFIKCLGLGELQDDSESYT